MISHIFTSIEAYIIAVALMVGCVFGGRSSFVFYIAVLFFGYVILLQNGYFK